MNSFYHAFSIGFNYWFLLLPLEVILMIALGASNAKLDKRTNKILRRDKNGMIASFFSLAMDVILMIAVLRESTAGIIQMIDNNLSPNDDPIWSLVIFVLAMVAFAYFAYYLFFGTAIFGRQVKVSLLREMRRKR